MNLRVRRVTGVSASAMLSLSSCRNGRDLEADRWVDGGGRGNERRGKAKSKSKFD